MLSGEEDNMSAIMTINPGAGGTKVRIGRNAYAHVYHVGKEWNEVKELDFQSGDAAGIKSVTLQFDGDFPLEILRKMGFIA